MPLPPELPRLEKRSPDSFKGNFGRALLIGGSYGMAGAIGLAGMSTLRGGAGLVTLAVPRKCLDTVAAFEPSYMTLPLPADRLGRIAASARLAIESAAEQATCIALGPGLGRSAQLTELVGGLHESLPQPMVMDADGLNALATRPKGLAGSGGPRILTPHIGEFRRLAGDKKLQLDEDGFARARALASEYGLVIVLKSHRTLVTDGRRDWRNTTGNPGMGTGGSGDVLTGVVAALVCQGLEPFEAAQLGVYVHGLAGDLAAEQLGEVSLIASDLVRFLPEAMKRVSTS